MDTLLTATTTLTKDSVSVTLEGKCLMCGWCCERMCTDNCMTDDGKCRYLSKADENGLRLCLIQKAYEAQDEVYLAGLSAEVLAYWKRYCQSFPFSIIQDWNMAWTLESLARDGWPCEGCGFTMVVVK